MNGTATAINIRPVVVYDGECRFCRRQVERVRRRDHHSIFELAARQQPGLVDRFPRLAEGDLDAGMRLVETDGTILVGADAVHGIARRLRPWKWLAWLYVVPGLKLVFRAIYAWIARNRHRLAGRCDDGSCRLPSGESDAAERHG